MSLLLHLGLLAVPDRLDQQVAQALPAEGLTEHVEDLIAERLALLVQLLEEPLEDLALASVLGDEVPQVADLGLADAVNPAEPLLDAVRVPRQVVVDHEVSALKVDALAGGVGRDEDQDVLVLDERFLDLAPLLARHAAVDRDDRVLAAQQRAQLADQVVQGVAVLAEDDQLAPAAVRVEHLGGVLERGSTAPPTSGRHPSHAAGGPAPRDRPGWRSRA